MSERSRSETPRPEEPASSGSPRWRPSISLTLIVGFGLLLLAAVGSVMWVAFDVARQNTLELWRSTAELTVDSIAARTEQHLQTAADQAHYLAERVADGEVEPEDPTRLTELMLGSLAGTPQVSGVAFVRSDLESFRVGRRNGRLLRLSSDWSERDEIVQWIQRLRESGRPSASGVIWVDDLSAPHVEISVPTFRNSVYLGTFVSIVSIQELSRFLAELEAEFGTHNFILHGRDRVLAHPALVGSVAGLSDDKPLPSLDEIADPVLRDIWSPTRLPMEILEDSDISGHYVQNTNEQQLYIYREIARQGDKPWIIGVHVLGSEVGAPVERLKVAFGTAAVILVAALVAAFFLGRAIARPVKRLAEGSLAIRNLDLSGAEPLGHSLFRELDTAAVAYNAMLGGLRRFETYVPKRLVLRLMQLGDRAVASEERTVTVMFTDIVNFSALSESQEPSALLELLNWHFGLLLDRIEAEAGTVDKYIGDSIMAFWGAPDDQPDHAVAACRTALAIRATVAADNARRRAQGQAPLGVRLGVHSGSVVVGNIGAPGRVNYTLIGDAVNVAQRLEQLGKTVEPQDPDVTILISSETAARLDDRFKLSAVGTHQLRGRQSSTEVFALLEGPVSETAGEGLTLRPGARD